MLSSNRNGLCLIKNKVESLTPSIINRVVSPVWSPDGNFIAFGCDWVSDYGDYGDYNLCIMDKEGVLRSTPDDPFPQPIFLIDPARAPEEFCVGGGALSSLTWSPDGERLAFTCLHSNLEDHLACIIDLEGEMDCWSLALLFGQDSIPRYTSRIAWSPTDDLLAVSVDSKIYLSSLDGQESRFLTDGFGAAWSPDGERLAFFSYGGIHVIDRDGTHDQIVYATPKGGPPSPSLNLYERPRWIRDMAVVTWSPDGRFIAFTGSWQFDGSDGIYRLDLRTGEVELITVVGDGQFYDPNWSR